MKADVTENRRDVRFVPLGDKMRFDFCRSCNLQLAEWAYSAAVRDRKTLPQGTVMVARSASNATPKRISTFTYHWPRRRAQARWRLG
jgi:hypothetical protein